MALPTQRYALRRLVDAALAREHLKARPVVEANGPAIILAMVKGGTGPHADADSRTPGADTGERPAGAPDDARMERPLSVVTRNSLMSELEITTLVRLARSEASCLVGGGLFGAVCIYPEQPARAVPAPDRRAPLRFVSDG